MKSRTPLYVLFTLASLGTVSSSWAQQNTPPKAAPAKPAKPAPPKEVALEGELRLDGKITVLLGTGNWVVEAASWTSPKGVTTTFDELKSKTVFLNADAFLHPKSEWDKVPLADIKVGSRVAIIGKNQPDGTVKVREVVLLEGYGTRKTVGRLSTNPETSRLIDLGRKSRDAGQINKALEYTTRAAEIAAGMGDASGEALATNDLALLYRENDEPEKAMQAFVRCEVLGRALGNPLVLSLALRGKGGMLLNADQVDEAIKTLQEADPISVNAPPTIRPGVLKLLAYAYCVADQSSDALGVMQKLYPLQLQTSQGDDALETRALMAVIQSVEEPDAAKSILDEIMPRVASVNNDETRSDVTGDIGIVLWRTGDKENADVQFEKAAKIMEDAGKKSDKWRNMSKNLQGIGESFPAFWAVVNGAKSTGEGKAEGGEDGKNQNAQNQNNL